MIKIWTKGSQKHLAAINLGTAVNSVCCCYVNDEPVYLVAGTFNGGVALISIRDEKVIKIVEKKHKCYASSVCSLSQYGDRYACSISAD